MSVAGYQPDECSPPIFDEQPDGSLQQQVDDSRRRRHIRRNPASGDVVHAAMHDDPDTMAALRAAGVPRVCLWLVFWVKRQYLWYVHPFNRAFRETCCCYPSSGS